MSTTNKNKPADTLRDGAIRATIWRNQSDNGVFFTTEFTRTYQDDQGTYHDSHSFSGVELLKLAHLAGRTYDRIGQLMVAEKAQQSDDESGAQ